MSELSFGPALIRTQCCSVSCRPDRGCPNSLRFWKLAGTPPVNRSSCRSISTVRLVMLPNELGIAPEKEVAREVQPSEMRAGCPMNLECLLPARQRRGQESSKAVRLPKAAGIYANQVVAGIIRRLLHVDEWKTDPVPLGTVTPNQPEQGVLSTAQPVLFDPAGSSRRRVRASSAYSPPRLSR